MGYVQSCEVQEVRTADVEGLRCPRRTGAGRRPRGGAVPVSVGSGFSPGPGAPPEVLVVPMTDPIPAGRRVVIIGGVAGGMSTATRLRRLDARATITVLERSGHVSFANCGLPYFVGGLIEEEEDLTLQTPHQLFDRFRLDVRVNDEVVAIDRAAHTVTTRSTLSGDRQLVPYDKLVLSTGAAPVRPPIPGYDRVKTLRTVEDAASHRRRGRGDPRHRRGDRSRVHRSRNGREPGGPGVGHHRGGGGSPGADTPRCRAGRPGRRRAGRPRRRPRARDVGGLDRGEDRHPVRRPCPRCRPGGGRHRCPTGRPVGGAGRPAARAGGWVASERQQPDQRPRRLRGGRCGGEAGRRLPLHLPHRPGQCGQPPGTPGGGPHRRAPVAPGGIARHLHREGVRHRGGDGGDGTNGASGPPGDPSGPSTPTPSTTPPTTPGRPGWRPS